MSFIYFINMIVNNNYKLGDSFNEVNSNFGGIKNIAETILKKQNYTDMNEILNEMGKLFYENICKNKYSNEPNLNIITFLVKEAEKYSQVKNNQLKCVASILKFVEDVQEKIYNEPKLKDKNEKFEFKLDDLYNFLNEKQKIMNCSNIFKKQKEWNNLFSPSFIYYINKTKIS